MEGKLSKEFCPSFLLLIILFAAFREDHGNITLILCKYKRFQVKTSVDELLKFDAFAYNTCLLPAMYNNRTTIFGHSRNIHCTSYIFSQWNDIRRWFRDFMIWPGSKPVMWHETWFFQELQGRSSWHHDKRGERSQANTIRALNIRSLKLIYFEIRIKRNYEMERKQFKTECELHDRAQNMAFLHP